MGYPPYSEPRPSWRASQPVEVDLSSLANFAKTLGADIEKNLLPDMQKAMTLLSVGNGGKGSRSFGNDPEFEEPDYMANYHKMCVDHTVELLKQVQRGLTAISWAAADLGINYGGTDSYNASLQVGAVDKAFNPDAPDSLARQVEKAETQPPPPPADTTGDPGTTAPGNQPSVENPYAKDDGAPVDPTKPVDIPNANWTIPGETDYKPPVPPKQG
jgi:hypothetical protein